MIAHDAKLVLHFKRRHTIVKPGRLAPVGERLIKFTDDVVFETARQGEKGFAGILARRRYQIAETDRLQTRYVPGRSKCFGSPR
jgi:hypothetical protein